MCRRLTLIQIAVAVLLTLVAARAEELRLEQVVSREFPTFNIEKSRLAVGRDGNVYLGNAAAGDSAYALRVSRDGQTKLGGKVVYALGNVTANAAGVIATANGHFNHSVNLYTPAFVASGKVADFLVNDQVGWDAPAHAEAGASGDFYGVDQHRNRVVRLSASGQVVTTYPIRAAEEKDWGRPGEFRVWEAGQRFYWVTTTAIVCTGWDGKTQWQVPANGIGGNLWDGYRGGFDVSDDGTLYTLTHQGGLLRRFGPDGQPTGELKLALSEPTRNVTHLRVWGDDVVLKRADATELFQVYDRTTGALKTRVPAACERLTVTFPGDLWTAGATLPCTIKLESGDRPLAPAWHLWWRPLGTPRWQELPITAGQFTVPAEAGGIYQIAVTPSVDGSPAEYTVQTLVEVRQPGAIGSATVVVDGGRHYYRGDEAVTGTVVLKVGPPPATAPASVTVELRQNGKVAAAQTLAVTDGKVAPFRLALPAGAASVALALHVAAPGFTSVDHWVSTMPGRAPGAPATPWRVQYGDYGATYTEGADLFSAPDVVARQLERSQRLGFNLFVDRLGSGGQTGARQWPNTAAGAPLLRTWAERVAKDPLAPAPEALQPPTPLLDLLSGYHAQGQAEMGILLMMDASLPLGRPFDNRTPEQMLQSLRDVTTGLATYPAFRGWAWNANWWVADMGAAAAATPPERAAYEVARKQALATGQWDAVLDTVSTRQFELAPAAHQLFLQEFRKLVPDKQKVSALSGPWRNLGIYPPVAFRDVDEVDLHYQSEQIQPPQVFAHDVDFQRRPGKPAWGHPEVWNDSGTGDQILNTNFQLLMRGADGIGCSGNLPNWPQPDDPRNSYSGTLSAFRAMNRLVAQQAPLLKTLTPHSDVAILVSRRMSAIDDWHGPFGRYFGQLFEAYNACLYAHRPAAFVFPEDLKDDTLSAYKAVLVVGQQVELDPPLAAALTRARAAGVAVFADGTCRAANVPDCRPLGITCDRIAQDESAWQDDAAYWRLPGYFRTHAAALESTLGQVVPSLAPGAPADILVTECRSAKGERAFWVVNNTFVDLDPSQLWRVSNAMSNRLPQVVPIQLPVPPGTVVEDVFAGARLSPDAQGRVLADLRSLPARLLVTRAAAAPTPVATTPGGVPPADSAFGPHLKSLALSGDGQTVVANAMNWDRNLYALDVRDGKLRWQRRVGQYFTFSPQAAGKGVAVQGFDFTTPEGYQQYLLDAQGQATRRFSLYGLPKRLGYWFVPGIMQDQICNFATPKSGAWVASAGDLGLAVWAADGTLKWQQNWWKENRHTVRLLAADEQTLVVAAGTTLSAYRVADGAQSWSLTLATTGEIQGVVATPDGKFLAARSTTEGGRVWVLTRAGTAAPSVQTLYTAAEGLALASDGQSVAVSVERQVRWYDVVHGLRWTATADDTVHQVALSPDGQTLAAPSILGTLYLFNRDGKTLLQRDFGALVAPVWLPDGDLLAGTWEGDVYRLDHKQEWIARWHTHLVPEATDLRGHLLDGPPPPTTRVTGWGTAANTVAPLTPNLLKDVPMRVTFALSERAQEWQNPLPLLSDGAAIAPPQPWLRWSVINNIDNGWNGPASLTFDTHATQLQLTGMTFVEDPAHPESWLRDAVLEWWDAAAEKWVRGPAILADAPAHTHWFDPPIAAAKFRLVSSGGIWPLGNLRLAELVLHGTTLGCSHPDAQAKRPLAVLFDEQESDARSLTGGEQGAVFQYADAYRGGKCLRLNADRKMAPAFSPPYGHAVPNWDFPIVEQPGPGEYRYLQFAWKVAAPSTTGIALVAGPAWPGGGVAAIAGTLSWDAGIAATQAAGPVPATWQVVRVDLWALMKKPFHLQSIALATAGGPALFDQLVLGRSEADLPVPVPAK